MKKASIFLNISIVLLFVITACNKTPDTIIIAAGENKRVIDKLRAISINTTNKAKSVNDFF